MKGGSYNYIFLLYFLLLTTVKCGYTRGVETPKVTVVIVVDQLAHRYLVDMRPYLKGGLKTLLDNGVVYENAYVPHAMPATGTGHAGLTTGTFATYHGIIGNHWFDSQGKKIRCDEDSAERAAVFSPSGIYDYGKSSHFLMVDGISDHFADISLPSSHKAVYSISLKSRTAILTANKFGKAIWFDDKGGQFTSSNAFFSELPDWLKRFNKNYVQLKDKTFLWHPIYDLKSNAYQWHSQETYAHVHYKKPIINTVISIKGNDKAAYEIYEKTPFANQLLLDLASTVVKTQLKRHDSLLLWLDISSLDKLGHFYGPNSNESLDLIYHIDRQLGVFISFVQRMVGKNNALFVLAADHGVSPMVQLMNKKGYHNAHIINQEKIISKLNDHVFKKYGIEKLFYAFYSPQFFINEYVFNTLAKETRDEICSDVKKILLSQPGIKQVWTRDKLSKACGLDQIESFFKKQLFKGRSGYFIVQMFPYSLITKYQTGTSHNTPYGYNTAVPLVLYWPKHLPSRVVSQKVWSLQLPNTLADLLRIERPSASTFKPLPGYKK